MANLIIIRGNSGSGKTTLANELQRKFGRNTLVISQDIVRREMLWVKDRIGNEAVDLMINLLQYGAEHCEMVILEGILYSDIISRFLKLRLRYTAKAYMRIIMISLLKKPWQDTPRNTIGFLSVKRKCADGGVRGII